MAAGRFVRAALLAAMLAPYFSASADQAVQAPTIDPSRSCIAPQYPPAARRAEQQGTVVLNFLIGPDGVPLRSEIVSSSGFPDLDKAAQDALLLCHFRPGQIDGKPDPRPGWAKIRYTWRLEGNGIPAAPPMPVPAPAAAPFSLKCAAKPSAADFSEQLEAITTEPKVGGTVRVVLPPISGVAVQACADFYHRAQIEALRRAQLFDHIDLAEEGRDGIRPRMGEADYTLWIQSGVLTGAYRGGPRAAFGNNPQGLAAWVREAPTTLKTMRDWHDARNFTVGVAMIGGQPYLAFHGKEYLTTADLELAAGAEAAAEVKALAPGAPIGKRAHILVTPEEVLIAKAEAQTAVMSASTAKLGPQAMDINLIAISQLASRVAGYAVAREWAQAVRQAGLFKTVEISEGDLPDPLSAGYDAVMWNDGAAPFKWKLRDASGTISDVPVRDTAQQWTDGLRATLTGNVK